MTRRILNGLLIGALAVAPATAEPQPTVDRVWPVAPADGAVVKPGTMFELGYAAMGDPHPRDLRFRIRLRPAENDRKAYVFDQRERQSGWMIGDEQRMLYRTARPLLDGEYRWDVAAWNGREWVEGGSRFELRIDSVAPADVEGLRVVRDPASGSATLEWDPVALDRDGRPEFVARYHVYRYNRGEAVRKVRVHEIGTVEVPRFVDTDPEATKSPLLLYRVTAEDEAGNEGGPG